MSSQAYCAGHAGGAAYHRGYRIVLTGRALPHRSILLDGKATNGQLMVGRFDVSEGEAPPYHKHTREDEVFMLIKGTALLWLDDKEMELSEGGIVFLPKDIPHAYRITSKKADLLMINTPAGIEGCSPASAPTRNRRRRRGTPDENRHGVAGTGGVRQAATAPTSQKSRTQGASNSAARNVPRWLIGYSRKYGVVRRRGGMFRYAGRDRATPRGPEGFEITRADEPRGSRHRSGKSFGPREGVDDEAVQDLAVDVGAHYAGAVEEGQQPR